MTKHLIPGILVACTSYEGRYVCILFLVGYQAQVLSYNPSHLAIEYHITLMFLLVLAPTMSMQKLPMESVDYDQAA